MFNKLVYQKILKIVYKRRNLHKIKDREKGIILRMHQLLLKKEPDYQLLLTKIKSEIKTKPREGYSDVFTKKDKKVKLRIAISATAAIILALLALKFSDQLFVIIKGHDGMANPEIVAKLSQVYDRNKATLIIDDSLKVNLNQDSAVFDNSLISGNFSNRLLQTTKPKAQIKETIKINTLIIPKGGEFYVTLPDGSKVFLNSNSKLTFPSRFENDQREVQLEGEALFEVKKSGIPFRVLCGNSSTTVLGTVF